MESTLDIEATRTPESKQKQRIDMLQHNLHNIIQAENEFHSLMVHQADEETLGRTKGK